MATGWCWALVTRANGAGAWDGSGVIEAAGIAGSALVESATPFGYRRAISSRSTASSASDSPVGGDSSGDVPSGDVPFGDAPSGDAPFGDVSFGDAP